MITPLLSAEDRRNLDRLLVVVDEQPSLTPLTWYWTAAISHSASAILKVLDEILDNETELPLFTRATDTAEYTELIFSLFDLLGY